MRTGSVKIYEKATGILPPKVLRKLNMSTTVSKTTDTVDPLQLRWLGEYKPIFQELQLHERFNEGTNFCRLLQDAHIIQGHPSAVHKQFL